MTLHAFRQHRAGCLSWRRHAGCGERGAGLIEVLVAVLVLSVAGLGVAALQVHSLAINHGAMARSMATMAGYSMLDAMRADRAAALAGSYDTGEALRASACPVAGQSMASVQRHDWCVHLGQALGTADTTTGAIQCSGAACVVTVTFDDSRSSHTVVTKGML